MPKKSKKIKKNKKFKLISFKPEKVDYSKVRHETSVDQSDRNVPYNLKKKHLLYLKGYWKKLRTT